MTLPSWSILPLYRSYLRQVRLLPHLYLRHFFQIKGRDDVEAIISTGGEELRERKAYKFSKRIKRIERANNGDVKAFERILDLAYGRVGKLKWELLEPLLRDPTATLPEPIIPGVAKSRPPFYSPELKALLTSPLARSTKPLEKKDLTAPRTLPERADPSSEDARLFGPLSKRREVNIRHRFFRTEVKKVLPPFEVEVPQTETLHSDTLMLETLPIRALAGQNRGLVQDVQNLIGHVPVERPRPRRERCQAQASSNTHLPSECVRKHPSRWVRRRYRALLARIPRLVYDSKSTKEPFKVRSFPLAHFAHDRRADGMPRVDSTSLAWIDGKIS